MHSKILSISIFLGALSILLLAYMFFGIPNDAHVRNVKNIVTPPSDTVDEEKEKQDIRNKPFPLYGGDSGEGDVTLINKEAYLEGFEVGTSTGEDQTLRRVTLYFYNPSIDQGVGGTQCSKNGLVALERTIKLSNTPIEDTVRLLLKGDLLEEELRQGITTEFPLKDLTLEKITVSEGVATLIFKDDAHVTVGGSCRTAILWNQIRATVEAFGGIQEVRFLPEDLFQP